MNLPYTPAVNNKIYGTIKSHNGYWLIETEPQVAIRLKRTLAKIKEEETLRLRLSQTPENAEDLSWVLARWPHDLAPGAREALTKLKNKFEETVDLTSQILEKGAVISPSMEALREPRGYQNVAANLAYTTKTLLLSDALGLGKTFSSLLLLGHTGTLPAIVVCPPNLTRQWRREIAATFDLEVHEIKSQKNYDIVAEHNKENLKKGLPEIDRVPDIILVSYSKLSHWVNLFASFAKTVIYDEIHELRRVESQKHSAACKLSAAAEWTVGLTGTPVANHGGEIHHIISALTSVRDNPLGSKHEFVREWGRTDHRGKVIVKDPAALALTMREMGILLRRERNEVGLPLTEPLIATIPTGIDLKLLNEHTVSATELAERILDPKTSSSDKWQASGKFDLELRKATGIAKANEAAAFAEMLLKDEHEKVVVFLWHRAVYDVLNEKLKEFNPTMYSGSETPVQKQQQLDEFLLGSSQVLLMSLGSASGIDGLQEVCNTGIVAELPWTPLMMEQALGRILRPGQESVVLWNILVADHGSDPIISEILGGKTALLKRFNSPTSRNDVLETPEKANERIKLMAENFLRQKK